MSDRAGNEDAIEGGARAAEEVVRIVGAAVRGRALILGSLPPHGRDVDLLVDDGDAERIGSAFRGAGLVAGGSDGWALFRGCAAVGVELARAASMVLPDDELAALFADGIPLADSERIVEPAPHHALLILARRLSGSPRLEQKHRERIEHALARDANAWEHARRRAPAWAAAAQLAGLERLYRQPAVAAPARGPRRLRWTRALAVSGAAADVGLHARALRDALHRLGYEAALVEAWPRTAEPGGPQALRWAGSALALWRRRLAHLGRVDVVVFAGHAADHAVSLGGGRPGRAARSARILRLSAPRPRRLYLLDPADDASDERPEAYRTAAAALGALRVDASLSTCARCELVAKDAWAALGQRGRLESALRRLTSRGS